MSGIVIAIDGPSASGKSSTARGVACPISQDAEARRRRAS